MRAGAERHASVDAQRDGICRLSFGDVRGMDPERADCERPEGALVLRHPILVRQAFPVPAGIDRGLHCGLVPLAEDFDAPRPIAGNFAAGDDEALLREVVERLLAHDAVLRRDLEPRRPEAHAASMKLSRTFFAPAFSNSMSSLLPSTAMMRP